MAELLASHQFYCRGFVATKGKLEQVLGQCEGNDSKINVLQFTYRDGATRLLCPCLDKGLCVAATDMAEAYVFEPFELVPCPYNKDVE